MTTYRPSAEDLIFRGSAEIRSGELDAAVETLSQAIALEPGATRPYWMRAEAYRRLDMAEEAAADEAKAAEIQRRKSIKPGYRLIQDQRARVMSNDSLFSFDGRLGQFEYFKHWLYSAVIILTGGLIGMFLGPLGGVGAFLGTLALISAVIAGWWIVLASTGKRLRDLERDEALVLLVFVPVVSLILWVYLLSAKSKT